MRMLWVIALVACGAKQPAPPPPNAPLDEDLAPARPPDPPEVAPAPPRLWSIAWLKAGTGNGGFGEAVALRADGSVVVGGDAELARWQNKRYARLRLGGIALLDAKGDVVWVRDIGVGTVRAIHASGERIYACGDFETYTLDGKQRTAKNRDLFVVALDASGKHVWTFATGTAAYESCNDLATLPDGRLVMTGSIQGAAKFGDLTAQAIGQSDAYVAVLDAAGVVQWIAVAGGDQDDRALALAIADNAIYVTGHFGGNARFGEHALALPASTGRRVANPSNLFVARYSFSGDTAWAQSLGAADSFDGGWSIAPLSDGGVAVAGEVEDRPIVARYAKDGTRTWVKPARGNRPRAIVALPGDDLVVVTADPQHSPVTRYSPAGDVLGEGILGGLTPHTNDERNGDEVDITNLATDGKRLAFVGRLVGTTKITAGTMFRESPAQVTAKDFQEILVVVADAP